jgi:hypothetical protein
MPAPAISHRFAVRVAKMVVLNVTTKVGKLESKTRSSKIDEAESCCRSILPVATMRISSTVDEMRSPREAQAGQAPPRSRKTTREVWGE